jgi:hypothetical protein
MKIAQFVLIATMLAGVSAHATTRTECAKNRNKESLTKLPEQTAAQPWLALWDGPKGKETVIQPAPKSTR